MCVLADHINASSNAQLTDRSRTAEKGPEIRVKQGKGSQDPPNVSRSIISDIRVWNPCTVSAPQVMFIKLIFQCYSNESTRWGTDMSSTPCREFESVDSYREQSFSHIQGPNFKRRVFNPVKSWISGWSLRLTNRPLLSLCASQIRDEGLYIIHMTRVLQGRISPKRQCIKLIYGVPLQ